MVTLLSSVGTVFVFQMLGSAQLPFAMVKIGVIGLKLETCPAKK